MLGAREELEAAKFELDAMRARKDGAYTERNRLVALLAAMYPSSLERHPDEDKDWSDDWRWIVYIDFPYGQASWHIHDSHLHLFDHVGRYKGRKYDGHTTEEKYQRLEKYVTALAARQIRSGRAASAKMSTEG